MLWSTLPLTPPCCVCCPQIVGDGVAFASQGLVVDEASLTGESDPIKKNLAQDPWVRSGTQVSEGSGKVLTLAVGPNSEWGKTMALMEGAGDEQTPLQDKLEEVSAKSMLFRVQICRLVGTPLVDS